MSSYKRPLSEECEEELKFRKKIERVFGDLSTYLVFSSDFEKAIDYFLSEIGRLFKQFMVESVIVYLFEESTNEQGKLYEWNSNRVMKEKKIDAESLITNLLWTTRELKDGKEVFLHKESKFPDKNSQEYRYLKETEIETFLSIPIFTPEYIAGTLILINYTSFYNWNEKELITLRIFADILGTAIYRKKSEEFLSRSRDHLQKEVVRKTRDLQAEKKRIELILNTIKDGVIVLDSDGKILMINKTAKNYLNKISEFPIQKGTNLLLSFGHPVFDIIREVFLSDEPKEVTFELLKDLYLQFVSTGENYYPDLESFSTILEIRDVTPFVEFDKMQKRFISIVSHELRTPITVINQSMSNYEKYGQRLPENTKNKLLSAISRNSKLLQELVEDLLTISRIDEKQLKLHWQIYDLNEILLDVLNQLEPRRKTKNISITISGDVFHPLVGDPMRIAQVIRIIIDNSLKYSNDGGSIEIRRYNHYKGKYNPENKNGVLIQFSDTGIGIREEDLSKLFNRFFRSTDVSHITGTGLGLGIAKNILELHEGSMFIESEFGKGTDVMVFLPRMEKNDLKMSK